MDASNHKKAKYLTISAERGAEPAPQAFPAFLARRAVRSLADAACFTCAKGRKDA